MEKKKKEEKMRWNRCCHCLPRGGFGLYKSTGPNTAAVTQRHPCGKLTEITAASLYKKLYLCIYNPFSSSPPPYHPLPLIIPSLAMHLFINHFSLFFLLTLLTSSYTTHSSCIHTLPPSIYSSLCQLMQMGRGHH